MIDPKLGEKTYDPFCGTGGMLTETFKHINSRMPQNENSTNFLKHHTVYGKELTSIARIAKMNMILIGDGHNNITQADSLETPVYGKYDAVITNIPFSQETDWGNLYDIPTHNGDSICIQHCLKALNPKNPNSRAGIIVPEGFLFDSKFKIERKWLIENFDLYSVVSLPSGVFLPYTLQKTDILYVKLKDKSKKKDKVWFYNVASDGYTLDNYRKPLRHNDLDNLLDGVGFEPLELEKIKANHYQLVKSFYEKKGIIQNKHKTVSLKSIATVMFGNSAPQRLDLFEGGTYPFVRISDLAKKHIDLNLTKTRDKLNDEGIKGLKLFPKGTILFPKSGKTVFKNHRGILGREAYITSHFACIVPDTNKVDPYYLLHCLINIKAEDILINDGYPSIRKDIFENLNIPLPSLKAQKEAVKELHQIVELETQIDKLNEQLAKKFGIDILSNDESL